MKKTMEILAIIFLIGAAAALGLLIYSEMTWTQPALNPPAQIKEPDSPTATGEERGAALLFPKEGSSPSERARHTELLAKFARESDALSINACSPDPFILRVSLTRDFTITNADSKDHAIRFQKTRLLVPAGGTLRVRPSETFNKGAGDYGYMCDENTAPVGVFFVR